MQSVRLVLAEMQDLQTRLAALDIVVRQVSILSSTPLDSLVVLWFTVLLSAIWLLLQLGGSVLHYYVSTIWLLYSFDSWHCPSSLCSSASAASHDRDLLTRQTSL